MRPGVVAAVAWAALVTGGCGGNDRRESLDDYIGEVNSAQSEIALHLGSMNKKYERFGSTTDMGALVPGLELTVKRLESLRRRVRRLEPPPDARRLDRRLLRLLNAQIGLAKEVVLHARYQTEAEIRFRRVAPAERRLRARLAAAKTAEQQAAAFRSFGAAIAGARRALSELEPPPVLAQPHRDQLVRFTSLERVCTALAVALEADDRPAIQRLLSRYQDIVAQAQTPASLRTRRAAVVAYNDRVRRIDDHARAVEAERRRLEEDLND